MQDDTERLRRLNTVGLISYVLHLIVAVGALIPGGQWGPTLLIVALILDFVKKDEAQGTWHASHFRWRIRSVVIAFLAYLVTFPLWLLFVVPGWVAWLAISAWFLYRIVKGMARMNAGQPMEFAE
ncbi:DUF4870 family protein [Macromonas nakdongensis]|jgi:uncharacterized membrane protein|uniref:DUF4870 family protein n=1 Tax=Macromonas nakdongensis TaxID=1843082 RepID=UPI000C344A56|nr:hypothetical protein [Macromonas nakdongensis]